MKLRVIIDWLKSPAVSPDEAPDDGPLGIEEDPFDSPVILEIRDILDLHSIPPAQSRAVIEAWLEEARRERFCYLRIIHGKGIGVQREIVRNLLARTSFVEHYCDAPPEAGGLGATLVTLKAIGDSK